MQLAGDTAAFFFLGCNQLCGQVLEIAGILDIQYPLPADTILEPAGVDRGEQTDAEAGREGKAEASPQSALSGAVNLRDLFLLLHKGSAIEGLHFLGDTDDQHPFGHDLRTDQDPGVSGPGAAVGVEDP